MMTSLQTVHFVKATPERAEKSGPTARRERIEPFAGLPQLVHGPPTSRADGGSPAPVKRKKCAFFAPCPCLPAPHKAPERAKLLAPRSRHHRRTGRSVWPRISDFFGLSRPHFVAPSTIFANSTPLALSAAGPRWVGRRAPKSWDMATCGMHRNSPPSERRASPCLPNSACIPPSNTQIEPHKDGAVASKQQRGCAPCQ